MARITIETKKIVGSMYKIQQDIYEIPNSIVRKGYLLYWDSRTQGYRGNGGYISGIDYVQEELLKNQNQEEME